MSLLAPEQIDIAQLPSLPLADRNSLPNCAAVYFVLDADANVLYIGRAKSLCFRWQQHHRFRQFSELPVVYIAWLSVTDERLLPSIEQALIEYFDPYFNHRLVPGKKLRQTAVRVAPEVLRLAKFYLREQGSNLQEFLSGHLERYVEEQTKEAKRERASVSA